MCAPFGANYEAFYSALETSRVPRLLVRDGGSEWRGLAMQQATLPHAGHTQLLDVRNALLVDPCAAGTDDDAFVRQVCLGTMVSWIECWCASSSSALSVQEMVDLTQRHSTARLTRSVAVLPGVKESSEQLTLCERHPGELRWTGRSQASDVNPSLAKRLLVSEGITYTQPPELNWLSAVSGGAGLVQPALSQARCRWGDDCDRTVAKLATISQDYHART
eukprot:340629-Hanusia_phi.AAC.4